ncbi:hypothetical protein QNN86_09015, partial [Citrobacter sp. C348]|uniref:hypothetical protein n=1 Tax=Citrobacter sp. C348 TaxID=3048143 RepID=UPI0039C1B763
IMIQQPVCKNAIALFHNQILFISVAIINHARKFKIDSTCGSETPISDRQTLVERSDWITGDRFRLVLFYRIVISFAGILDIFSRASPYRVAGCNMAAHYGLSSRVNSDPNLGSAKRGIITA